MNKLLILVFGLIMFSSCTKEKPEQILIVKQYFGNKVINQWETNEVCYCNGMLKFYPIEDTIRLKHTGITGTISVTIKQPYQIQSLSKDGIGNVDTFDIQYPSKYD